MKQEQRPVQQGMVPLEKPARFPSLTQKANGFLSREVLKTADVIGKLTAASSVFTSLFAAIGNNETVLYVSGAVGISSGILAMALSRVLAKKPIPETLPIAPNQHRPLLKIEHPTAFDNIDNTEDISSSSPEPPTYDFPNSN